LYLFYVQKRTCFFPNLLLLLTGWFCLVLAKSFTLKTCGQAAKQRRKLQLQLLVFSAARRYVCKYQMYVYLNVFKYMYIIYICMYIYKCICMCVVLFLLLAADISAVGNAKWSISGVFTRKHYEISASFLLQLCCRLLSLLLFCCCCCFGCFCCFCCCFCCCHCCISRKLSAPGSRLKAEVSISLMINKKPLWLKAPWPLAGHFLV